MKATILRVSGTTIVLACGLFLPVGMASAQTIDTTGPDSTNTITETNNTTCKVTNDNDVDVTNNNPQNSESGDVTGDQNTTVGQVTSGDATNSSDTSLGVTLTNGNGCLPSELVTPTPAPAPAPAPSPTPVVMRPAGGLGGGEQVAAPATVPAGQQVLAPVGGVGAGQGGTSVLATIASVTVASAIWFAARVRRQFAGLFG